MGHRGRRREGADAPSGHGGQGSLDIGPAPEQQADGSPGLRRQMQAAGGGEGNAGGHLGDDPGETGVAKAFFHDEQGRVPPRFGVDDAAGVKAGGGEARSKKVLLAEHPENGTGTPGQNAGGEQGGSCGEFEVDAGSDNLVQRGQGQAAPRQRSVEGRDAERQRFGRGQRIALDPGNAGAKTL